MKKIFLLPILALTFSPIFVQAQFTDVLDNTAETVYGSTDSDRGSITYIISQIINVLLSVLGVVLLILIIYAGFLWMTAGGDAEQVKKAKSFMINAAVGLIITLASYGIASFVIKALVDTNIVD